MGFRVLIRECGSASVNHSAHNHGVTAKEVASSGQCPTLNRMCAISPIVFKHRKRGWCGSV